MTAISSQLVAHLTQVSLNDTQVQQYGRYLVGAASLYYVMSSFQKDVPEDVKYAITGHMVQGYDRSIIGTRLEQRHTRQILQQYIGLNELRQQLREETDRVEKLRLWQQVFRRTLMSVVATTYTHSLTISLLAVKNMVRVLVFLLSRREAAEHAGRHGGALSTLRAWWTGGRRGGVAGIMMESMVAKLAAQADQNASPFTNAGLEEDRPAGRTSAPALDGRAAFVQSQQEWEMADAVHGESQQQVEHAFSVRVLLDLAMPRIVACAAAVVDRALNARQSHTFSVSGIVRGSELRSLLQDIATGMERCSCVAMWLRKPRPVPQPLSATRSLTPRSNSPALPQPTWAGGVTEGVRLFGKGGDGGLMGADGEVALSEERAVSASTSSDDVVEFPHGSTALLGPNGRPVRRRSTDRNDGDVIDELLGRQLTAEEKSMQEEALRRDHLMKGQMAGFFTELYQSASFGELTITYGAELLAVQLKEAGDIAHVRTYDAATDTAKMAMVITALDSCRLSALEEECEVKPYMRLFCEETVRSTCAQ